MPRGCHDCSLDGLPKVLDRAEQAARIPHHEPGQMPIPSETNNSLAVRQQISLHPSNQACGRRAHPLARICRVCKPLARSAEQPPLVSHACHRALVREAALGAPKGAGRPAQPAPGEAAGRRSDARVHLGSRFDQEPGNRGQGAQGRRLAQARSHPIEQEGSGRRARRRKFRTRLPAVRAACTGKPRCLHRGSPRASTVALAATARSPSPNVGMGRRSEAVVTAPDAFVNAHSDAILEALPGRP